MTEIVTGLERNRNQTATKRKRKETEMPTLDEMFPSPWLKAEDFAEGEEKQLTIRSWKLNTLPSKNGEKPKQSLDLTFDETNKVLGANYTNREALAKVFGSRNPNDWVGKTATFMTLWVDSWGETVRAVRVKPVPVPNTSKAGTNGGNAKPPFNSRTPQMSNNQRNKLVELYIDRYGGSKDEAIDGVDAVFEAEFHHPMDAATLAEASSIISKFIALKQPAPEPVPAATSQTLTVAKGFDMDAFRAKVAKQYPYYTDKNGKPNPYHILKTLVKVGIYNLSDDNADEAFAMLGYHAQAEEEAKQAA